jgi:hypothetical protein
MGLGLTVVAPGIWEFYRTTTTPRDEIVSLMGIAYTNASFLPDETKSVYYDYSFAAMRDLDIHTMWSLDSSLTITDDPLWTNIEKSPLKEVLDGILVGYGPSIDKAFVRDTGMPVLISQNGYMDNANDVKKKIEAIMALNPAQRSPINFLFVTNWSTTAESYYDVLSPLVERGVRFLTPREALACMPPIEGIAKTKPTIEPAPGECRPTGTLKRFGSDSLSAPTLAEINKPLSIPLTPKVDATAEIFPGGIIKYDALLEIDINSFIYDFYANRVIPVMIAYGLEPYFLEYAWTKFIASNIVLTLNMPEGTAHGEILDIQANNINASAKFEGNKLLITLENFIADVRLLSENPPLPEITISWTIKHDENVPLKTIVLEAEHSLLDFVLTVGVGEEEGPMVGAVGGAMKCSGADTLAETDISIE